MKQIKNNIIFYNNKKTGHPGLSSIFIIFFSFFNKLTVISHEITGKNAQKL